MKRFLVMAAVLASVACADDLPDDVGDVSASATLVSTGGAPLVRSIEWDADHDWFAFQAKPFVSYGVSVTTGTIFDCEIDLISSTGAGTLSYSNTAAGTAAVVTFMPTTMATRAYVRVRGLAEFTTGTYNLVVNPTFTDVDGDGLPDVWENAQFGTITNTPGADTDGDGFANGSEYLAGTMANSSTSALRITSIARTNGLTMVTWQALPNGLYRMTEAVTPTGTWSDVAGTLLSTNVSASLPDSTGTTTSVYRVELLY